MKTILPKQKYYLAGAMAAGLALLLSEPVYAAGSNMPWEAPLSQILQSIEGPVAKILLSILAVLPYRCAGL